MDSGSWSLTTNRAVFISNDFASPIVDAEYFWDEDPGVGGGTPLTLSSLGHSDTTDLELDGAITFIRKTYTQYPGETHQRHLEFISYQRNNRVYRLWPCGEIPDT